MCSKELIDCMIYVTKVTFPRLAETFLPTFFDEKIKISYIVKYANTATPKAILAHNAHFSFVQR